MNSVTTVPSVKFPQDQLDRFPDTSWVRSDGRFIPRIEWRYFEPSMPSQLRKLWQGYPPLWAKVRRLGVLERSEQEFLSVATQLFRSSGLLLDIGSGNCDVTLRLLEETDAVVLALDVEEEFLKSAREQLSTLVRPVNQHRIMLYHYDVTSQVLPCRPNSVDGAVARLVWSYLSEKGQQTALRSVARMLVPGGVFLFDFMLAGRSMREVVMRSLVSELLRDRTVLFDAMRAIPAFTEKVDAAESAGLIYRPTLEEVQSWCLDAGFSSVEEVGGTLPGFPWRTPTYTTPLIVARK